MTAISDIPVLLQDRVEQVSGERDCWRTSISSDLPDTGCGTLADCSTETWLECQLLPAVDQLHTRYETITSSQHLTQYTTQNRPINM